MASPAPLHIARYEDLAARIAEKLAAARAHAGPLAPWAEEIIVASRSVADAITSAFVALHPEGAAGLRAEPLESLARRILNAAGEYPRVASDAERRLLMRAAVRTSDDPVMQSRGIASMLERTYRDIRDSDVAIEQIPQRRERTRLIVRVWREYETLIGQVGAIDPSELFIRAAQLVQSSPIPPQIVAGFYDMTGVQLRFVDALRAAGKLSEIFVPADHPYTRPFIDHFCPASVERSEPLSGSAHPSPRVSVAGSDTRHDELRAVCREVSGLLSQDVSPAGIGVVARSLDEHDLQLLTRFAARSGFQFSRENATPLAGQRIGRAVLTLLRLRERGFLRSEVLELVRDGLLTRTALRVDVTDADTRRWRVSGGDAGQLRTMPHRSRGVDEYIALVTELEAHTDFGGKPWSAVIRRLAALFRPETPRDLAALDALESVSVLFQRVERTRAKVDLPMVIDAIEQCELAADPPSVPSIWIGDVMRLRGRTFDHLLVIRMQDDLFPQRRNEDPLLPDRERSEIGVREIGNGRDEERLLFHLLTGSARRSLRFSFAGTDGFGKTLRPSPLLKMLAIEREPERRQEILSDFNRYLLSSSLQPGELLSGDSPQPPAPLRPLQLLARAGSAGIFDGYVGERPEFTEALQAITPTQLEDFGECPQKYLFKYLLGARDFEDPEREVQINHRDKGTVDHRILERFYRSLTSNDFELADQSLPLLPASLAARLDQTIEEEFDRLEREIPPFNPAIRLIERRATRRNLRDFVALDLTELLARGLAPRSFEWKFGDKFPDGERQAGSFLASAGGVTIHIDGSIDRIDGDGTTLRIVDYKSGKALRHQDLSRKIDRGVRLQLALYAMAVATFFRAGEESVSGTIKPLISGRAGKFEFRLAEKRAGLQATLDTFVTAIRRGLFPAFPNEGEGTSDFNSCKYCPVNHSCRTRHDAEESARVRVAGEPRTLLNQVLGAGGSQRTDEAGS